MNGLLLSALTASALFVAPSLLPASIPSPTPPVAMTCVNSPLPQALAKPNTVAFVGTVSSLANSGLTAHVQVESVWVGSNPFPVNVDVSGGDPARPLIYPRRFTKGLKYLFVEPAGPSPYRDGLCSATRVYSAALESYKPAGAHPPLPIVANSQTALAVGRFLPWLGVLGLVVLLTVLLAVRDGGRRPRPLGEGETSSP